MRDPSRDQYRSRGDLMYTRNHSRDKYSFNRGEEPYRRDLSRDQYSSSTGGENRPPSMQPAGGEVNAMDVTLSLESLRGIIAQESSKHAVRGKVYGSAINQDEVRVMITVLAPEETSRGFQNITSEPLEVAETNGRTNAFTAMFPLNGNKMSSSITFAGLLQRGGMQNRNKSYGYSRLKPQPIELLISIVYQIEQICLGKATIIATGEEIRTKQIDVPIDVAKDSILKSQKRSTGGRNILSIAADRHGGVAGAAFKYDPTRRKYKIEKGASLRVYIKAVPVDKQASRSRSQQSVDTRGNKSNSTSKYSSRSRSTRDPQSSLRHQTSSRRSHSSYSQSDFLGDSPAPAQRISRSSSCARSHGGNSLTIEPQTPQGYRSKSQVLQTRQDRKSVV